MRTLNISTKTPHRSVLFTEFVMPQPTSPVAQIRTSLPTVPQTPPPPYGRSAYVHLRSNRYPRHPMHPRPLSCPAPRFPKRHVPHPACVARHPQICAPADDHLYSSSRDTIPARHGFCSTYRIAVPKWPSTTRRNSTSPAEVSRQASMRRLSRCARVPLRPLRRPRRLLRDDTAGDAVAGTARRIGLVVIGLGVDHHRGAAVGEE